MNRRVAQVAIGAALGISWANSAFAEDAAGAAPSSAATPPAPSAPATSSSLSPVARDRASVYAGPNRALVGAGLFSFGFSYLPAVVVAATSSQSADHHLYVPLAGPWLDLGERPPCRAGTSCNNERTNKVLIAADGVFQSLGFVTTILGFLAPDHERIVTSAKPSIQVTPTRIGNGGYGVAAFGNF